MFFGAGVANALVICAIIVHGILSLKTHGPFDGIALSV
jgi:hypothetical protein